MYLIRDEDETVQTDVTVLSTAKLKNHLVVEHSEDDTLIESYRSVAVSYIERITGHMVSQRTRVVEWDDFARHLSLPILPVQSLDTVETDDEGATTSHDVDDYYLHGANPVEVRAKRGTSGPAHPFQLFRVKVTAGYSDASDVPSELKQAVRQMVTDAYEMRADVVDESSLSEVPETWEDYVRPLRVIRSP